MWVVVRANRNRDDLVCVPQRERMEQYKLALSVRRVSRRCILCNAVPTPTKWVPDARFEVFVAVKT
jgi:hypothetical protein